MTYRTPKEIYIGKQLQRTYLVPVPGADGHWMLCHPSIRLPCSRCGAEVFEPCSSERGYVTLTGARARAIADHLDGDHTQPSRLRPALKQLRDAKCYRSESHEERIHAWRHSGHVRPPGTASERRKVIASLWRTMQWLRQETEDDKRLTKTIEKLEALLRLALKRREDTI